MPGFALVKTLNMWFATIIDAQLHVGRHVSSCQGGAYEAYFKRLGSGFYA